MWVGALMAVPLPLAFPFFAPLTRTSSNTRHTQAILWTPYLLMLELLWMEDVKRWNGHGYGHEYTKRGASFCSRPFPGGGEKNTQNEGNVG